MIIPAEGYNAIFQREGDDGEWHLYQKPVIAWQEGDDGEVVGLVALEHCIETVHANATYRSGFLRYEKVDKNTVIPAQPGWWCQFYETDSEFASYFNTAVIAWLISNDGSRLVPITEPVEGGPTQHNPTGVEGQEIQLTYKQP